MVGVGEGPGVPLAAPIRRGSNEVSMIRGGVMALAMVCQDTTFSFWLPQFPLPPLLLLWSWVTKSPAKPGPREVGDIDPVRACHFVDAVAGDDTEFASVGVVASVVDVE
jgi:hypothetical protein